MTREKRRRSVQDAHGINITRVRIVKKHNEDTPTYEKYNGSYTQDVMGYSDDDIDTIFDGDPSA